MALSEKGTIRTFESIGITTIISSYCTNREYNSCHIQYREMFNVNKSRLNQEFSDIGIITPYIHRVRW